MIPLEQGSVFRRLYCLVTSGDLGLSQSLWNRAVSSDTTEVSCTALDKSQSLWNRAVSSDQEDLTVDQWAEKVSIPLEQGSVFRRYGSREFSRCSIVSIPLEQGSVFRHITQATNVQDFLSQSLWNRAVSSDNISGETSKRC